MSVDIGERYQGHRGPLVYRMSRLKKNCEVIIFSFTCQRPEMLMRWPVVRRPSVRPSVSPSSVSNFVVNTLGTVNLKQS